MDIKKMDIQTKRRAICASRGGHENTDDAGIMILWNSLDEETQKQYLETIHHEGTKIKEAKKE